MRRNPAGLLTKTAALVAGVLALTGCIKMDMDMKLSSDDKVSGTVIVGFNGSLFEAMGQKPADVIKEMETEAKAELKKPENKLRTGTVSVKGYNKNGFVGLESSFKGILLSDLKKATGVASDAAASTGGSSASEDDFKIERRGNTYVFTGVMDLSDMADSSATTVKGQKTTTTMGIPGLDAAMFGNAELRIAITFPGTVTRHNGKLKGKTVTWEPVMGKKTTMNAIGNVR